jgi:thimet oligopeptidase
MLKRLFAASLLFASTFALAQTQTKTASFPGGALLAGTADQFTAYCKTELDNATASIAKLKAMPKPRNTMAALKALDDANLALNNAGNRSGLAEQVEPDENFRNAASKCEQDGSTLATKISLDREVYDAIAGLDISKTDGATKYLVKQTLSEFKRSGVDRDDATRAKIQQLNDDLTKIGQDFDRNISQGMRKATFTADELDGLPEDFKKAHQPGADGKITLETTYPNYGPFMKYAKNAEARHRFYIAYNQRAYPDNIAVLKTLLEKRYELATMLGYKNWADYVTENKMIGSGKNAADFIEKITQAADARMKVDYAELLEVAKADNPSATQIDPWSSSYYSERLRATKYQFDSQSVRPYFEYTRVKDGLLGIVSKMYGIQFRKMPDAKVWHPSVEAYDVLDGQKLLGRIYFDMFPRANKYSHAANFWATGGRAGSDLQETALVCNFPDPSKGPALMEQRDVNTFFHEFGHTLHSLFSGQPKWASYNYQWDFIEAPSQMFEEWTENPATLQLFAKHYQTGEVIPTDLVKRLKRSLQVGKGLGVRGQMSLAALSLDLHDRDPKDVNSDDMVKFVTTKYTPFPYVEGTHFQTAFTHLNGYSAIYYTYMWSLVIAKDLLTEFQKDGLMNPAVAKKYRKEVLEPGASKPAAELVTKFLGREYNFKAYENWLNQTE